jgi:S-adenosylmethionine synthetase
MLDLDSKVQVTSGGEKTKVVFSTQHQSDIDLEKLKEQVNEIVSEHISEDFILDLNPSGSFVKGGPAGDTGLTGRKIVVDAYGPTVPVGGGAFSGKDPSKVDRSAAYATRHIAKNLVAAGIVEEVLVQVAYAIGVAEPVGLYVNTYGTSKVNLNDGQIAEKLNEIFDMRPYAIEQRFNLRSPIYSETAAYGHMGRNPEKIKKEFTAADGSKINVEVELFPWEKLDYVEKIKSSFAH